MRIVLTDPGFRQEPRQIAAALSSRHADFRLVTSAYFTPRSQAVRTARGLGLDTLADHLLRRHEPAVDASAVRGLVFPDVLGPLLRGLRVGAAAEYAVVNSAFDLAAAALLRRGTAVVVAMQGSALRTLRRAARLGAQTVLVCNSASPEVEQQLIEEEIARLGLPAAGRYGRAARALARRIRAEQEAADVILVNSRFTGQSLAASGIATERIVTATLGVDVDQFSPAPEAARPAAGPLRVLYVGSLQARKGVVHLARAVRSLRARGVDCVLDAFGPSDREYLGLLRPFTHEGALRLHGPVSHHLLPDVYRAADVFVLPSIVDGFGLVAYEAMACGVPVVVSDRCGAEVRDHVDGLVVPAADADALADALEEVLTDASLRARLGGAGLETAARASWEGYRERVAGLLLGLAEGGTDVASTLVSGGVPA